MKIQTVIFDWDGTLHDTKALYGAALRQTLSWLEEQGYSVPADQSDDRLARYLGVNARDMWNDFMPSLPAEIKGECSRQTGEQMAGSPAGRLLLQRCLRLLPQRGNLPGDSQEIPGRLLHGGRPCLGPTGIGGSPHPICGMRIRVRNPRGAGGRRRPAFGYPGTSKCIGAVELGIRSTSRILEGQGALCEYLRDSYWRLSRFFNFRVSKYVNMSGNFRTVLAWRGEGIRRSG